MPRPRTIIPRCSLNQPIIDAFQCSECEWSYLVPGAEPCVIDPDDAEDACRNFDRHDCEHFKPREAKERRECSATEERRTIHRKGGKAKAKRKQRKN